MLLVHPLIDKEVKDCHSFDEEPQLVDVVDYLGDGVHVLRGKVSTDKPLIARLFFPPSKFPPPTIVLGKGVFLTLHPLLL